MDERMAAERRGTPKDGFWPVRLGTREVTARVI